MAKSECRGKSKVNCVPIIKATNTATGATKRPICVAESIETARVRDICVT